MGSHLTALKMEIYQLAVKLAEGKQTAPILKHIESMTHLIDRTVNVTRQVINDLHPAILDDLGLVAALEWEGENFRNRTGIACEILSSEEHDGESRLDKAQRINLFRIFQEALTNVLRHSGATRVEVEFLQGDEEVILAVCDNGCGFPENHTIAPTSYGLRSMRERVAQLGGQIKFDVSPGGGLNIAVILPLAAADNTETT
jgi:signal transduction histidine kinase